KVKQTFESLYRLFNVSTALIDQLQGLVRLWGYSSRQEEGYEYKRFSGLYDKYDCAFLKPFIGDFPANKLWVVKDGTEEDDVPVNLDIHWVEIKKALINKLRKESYFIFSEAETALLDMLIDGGLPLPAM